jgi:hypothetical protein
MYFFGASAKRNYYQKTEAAPPKSRHRKPAHTGADMYFQFFIVSAVITKDAGVPCILGVVTWKLQSQSYNQGTLRRTHARQAQDLDAEREPYSR